MIDFEFMTPSETASHLAHRVKEKRLEQNLSQQTLSERSNVSLAVIKRFERTGKISLESLLKLALALGCLADFVELFKPKPLEATPTLDELLAQKARKRGRR
jgi:transcriptional regulator with XRE-family HTH domain